MAQIPTIASAATGRRARLRKRSLADYTPPATTGPTKRTDQLGSLLYGMPEESAAVSGATAAEKMALEHGKWVVTHLKPILSPSAWKNYVATIAKAVK